MKPPSQLVLLVPLCLFILCGEGCSRMQKYRAQDSPLPGLPILGRKGRAASKNPAELVRKERPRGGDVVWSGQPNLTPPLVALDVTRQEPEAKQPSKPRIELQNSDPGLVKLRSLVQEGRERLSKIETYQVAMNRQERVGTSLLPAEDVLLSIRRNPKAVRLEWPVGSHKGREVIYSASLPGGMMHINMADSVVPIPRMTMSPDSPMVMKNSRHPITEAGLDAILDQLETSLKAQESGAPAGERLTYDGVVTPPEIGRPCHKITKITANGEIWVIDLDTETGLPTLVQENAANGDLQEKYVFRSLVCDPPALAEKAAFDPDGRWGTRGRLFGRMAQGFGAATPAVK